MNLKISKIIIYLTKRKIIILISLIPFLFILLYIIGDFGFILIDTNITLQDTINILTCFGTIFLGVVALEQNNKLDMVNRDLVSKSFAADHFSVIKAENLIFRNENNISILKNDKFPILLWDKGVNFHNATYANSINFRIRFIANEFISNIKYINAVIYSNYYDISDQHDMMYSVIKSDANNLDGNGYQSDFVFQGIVMDSCIVNDDEFKEFEVRLAMDPIEGNQITIFNADNKKNQCDILKDLFIKSKKNRFELRVEITNSFDVVTCGTFYFDFEILKETTNVLKKGFITTCFNMSSH